MIDRLISWAVRHRIAVFGLICALIAGGIWAFRTLRVEALPDLTDVQVQVLVEAPGLSPVEVERLVAFPTEVSMSGLPRVKQIRSISKYGLAAVTIVFEDGVDINFARTLVSERLQGVREALPPQAEASLGPLAGAISEIYLYTARRRGSEPDRPSNGARPGGPTSADGRPGGNRNQLIRRVRQAGSRHHRSRATRRVPHHAASRG